MLSKNMVRIIAKISGDGSLCNNNRQIMYFNTCNLLREEFKEDINKEFNNPTMSEGKMNSGTPYVAVYGKRIVNELKRYLQSYNSSHIFIPNEVINSSSNVLRGFIRTFYDDEGCASLRLDKKTRTWKRNITLSSNSYDILKQVKEVLETFGIKTNKIIRNYSNSNYDQSFVLGVTGKENFVVFKQMIGFKHPRKTKMLKLIIESYKSTSKYPDKFNRLKEKIKELVVPKK